ncbi:Pycsar system effector family protein [Streptomyces cellostaticus]|uniref:Pycsar system effector family protein n=1 Tax=Streptomyces cellostaticus TaxID=67285 RepID=UPI0020270506|nr:Pycsar system effector family protein [Streptomyces cellostaticus]
MTAGDEAARTSPAPVVLVPDGGRHSHDGAGERIAERLLDTIREDLGRADSKAAVLLSGALALPALLLGWHGPPGWRGPADVVLALAAVLWSGAVVALVGAVMPRTGTHRGRDAVTYFGDLVAARDLAGLSDRVAEAGRDPAGWLLVQAVDVSSILSAKYRAIRWGVGSLALSAALALAWGLTPR